MPKREFQGFMGLKYIALKGVPYEESKKHGQLIHASVSKQVERLASHAILAAGLPIRGREVAYYRSILGLSLKQFGSLLGYSDVAILKWERAKDKRLERVNEIAVRVLIAQRMGFSLDSFPLEVPADAKSPKVLEVEYRKEPVGVAPMKASAA